MKIDLNTVKMGYYLIFYCMGAVNGDLRLVNIATEYHSSFKYSLSPEKKILNN